MTCCPTCSYHNSHGYVRGCVLGLTQPCSRYSPGVEALEAWLRCECGGWIDVEIHRGELTWHAWCTACRRCHDGYRADPVAALVAFHEGRMG